jgi:hypothetical protein
MLRHRIRTVTTVFCMVGIDNMSHKYRTIKAKSAASNFLYCCHASRTISLLCIVTSTFRTDLYLVPPYFTVKVVWKDLSRITFLCLNSASLIFCWWTFSNSKWTLELNKTWRSWICASWYNYANNQQGALYILIYYSRWALHVSGDVFVHHQEHLTVFTISVSVHPSCCRPVSRME